MTGWILDIISHKKAKKLFVIFCLFVAIFLLRVGLHIIHREILERLGGESQIGGFDHGSSCVPFVDQGSLDEPHRGRPISAGTMDERGLAPDPSGSSVPCP